MSNTEYSFEVTTRTFGSPTATFGDSITNSGWADPPGTYASDTQDVVVNGATPSQSHNDFYSFMPEVDGQGPQPPSLPASPQVKRSENVGYNGNNSSSSQTYSSKFHTYGSGSSGAAAAGRGSRSRPGVRLSDDELKPTNSDSFSLSPKLNNAGNRNTSGDRYEYTGLLSFAAPSSPNKNGRGDGDRLPPLSNGVLTQGGSRRGSASLLSPSAGSSKTVTSPVHRSSSNTNGSLGSGALRNSNNNNNNSSSSAATGGLGPGVTSSTTRLPSAPASSTSLAAASSDKLKPNGSAEVQRRGSAQLTPQPPSFTKANLGNSNNNNYKKNSISSLDAGNTQDAMTTLYANLPSLSVDRGSGRIAPSSERRGSQGELPVSKNSTGSFDTTKRDALGNRDATHMNGSRKSSAPGTRTPTFVGVADTADTATSPYARTHPRTGTTTTTTTTTTAGAPSTANPSSKNNTYSGTATNSSAHRSDASSSPRNLATMRDGLTASTRTQSDGDLRLRSSSRNSEHGSSSGAGAPGASPDRRSRSASEPSPVTDEDGAYFPFGLMELPASQKGGGVVEAGNNDINKSSSKTRRGSGADTTDSTTSRFKPLNKAPAQPQSSAKAKTAAAGGAGDSPTTLGASPMAVQPYDLSFATGLNDSDEDEVAKANPFDYSALTISKPTPRSAKKAAIPAAGIPNRPSTSKQADAQRQDSEDDFLKEGGYGKLSGAALVGETKNTNSSSLPQTALKDRPIPSPRKTNTAVIPAAPQPSKRKAAPGLSAFQPLSSTNSTTAKPTTPTPATTLEKKPSTFEPVPMKTSAMSASGRHFAFDGAKRESPATTLNASENNNSNSNRTLQRTSSPSTRSPASPASTTLPAPVRSPVGAAESSKLEFSTSLSRSTSTRAPRPPSRHAVSRAAAVGDVVDVAADTLPAQGTPRRALSSEKHTTSPTSATTVAPVGTSSTTTTKSGDMLIGNLPSVAPASRRQSTRPAALNSVATDAAGNAVNASTSISKGTTLDGTTSAVSSLGPSTTTTTTTSSPKHRRLIKATNADASLSPIASDDDSVGSLDTAEQNAQINRSLRQVHSSVRIRTKVNESELLPTSNAPWPLRPPPRSIVVKLRVFDPLHPRPRGERMRELPDGKRQADWTPPVTHYTTTLADLAAYEDEEDWEEEEALKQQQQKQQQRESAQAAKLRAIQDFEEDIWENEDIDVDHPSSWMKTAAKGTTLNTATPSAAAGAAASASRSPLPPTPTLFPSPAVPRSITVTSAASPSENAGVGGSTSANARRSSEIPSAPLVRSADRGSVSASSSSKHSSTHKISSPAVLGFTPLPAAALAGSPYPDVPGLHMDGSLNISFNPGKRYGGIVVDEVEKVRRMREDSVFTPVMDDLALDTTRQTSLTVSERPGSSRPDSSVSPGRTKSPVLVGRGFNLGSASPKPGDVTSPSTSAAAAKATASINSHTNNNSSNANRTGVVQTSLSENNRHSSQSVRNDSVLLDANGNPVLPQSPSIPTFARIIAQRSGGYGGMGSAGRISSGSPGMNPQSASRDSIFSDYGNMMGGLGSFGDRKSMVTFAEDEPETSSRRRRY